MTRRPRTALPVLTGILTVLSARRALADAPSCASVAIEADASVSAHWPALVERVREAFEARDDVDRCARVALTMHGATVTVTAILPDGRSACRPVSGQDDVVPTLEALLLVPQRSAPVEALFGAQAPTAAVEPLVSRPAATNAMPPVPSGTSSSPTPRIVPSSPRLTVQDHDASSPSQGPSPGPSSSRLRIELSVVTGARIGDGQVALGLGAFSLLDLSGWLMGFEGRADRYKAFVLGTPESGVLELATLGGRRFRFRSIALDLLAGPALVLQGTTTFTSSVMAGSGTGGNQVTGSSSSTVPRLLLGARVNFGAFSVLRGFVGLDGELGPSRLGDGAGVPDVPRLPIWTLGLALGGTVATR
jgi:hypothetical protein